MNKQEFNKLLEKGPIILDGATGSVLRTKGMMPGVCSEVWINEHPQILMDLQREYVNAGSMVVYAPTFLANRFNLSSLGLGSEVKRLNLENVKMSKEAAEGKALVAGNLSTTSQPMEPFGTMTYEKLLDIYKEQIAYLCEAGVDYLAAETLLSLDEAMVLCDAAASECSLPLTLSFTCEGDGNLYFGGSIVEAAAVLQEMGASAVGINCSVGPDQLEAVVRNLKENVEIPVLAKPNAGVPRIDEKGVAHYSMDADTFALCMKRLQSCGASVLGGCCGTNPEYIVKMCQALG